MTLLLLIRHGMTDHTGTRLTGWTPAISLNALGREQADGVATRLDGLPVSAVFSSPLERCLETAQPLARDRTLRVRVRDELGEVRYGAWTGRTLKQLMRTKQWSLVQAVPSAARFPGGESLLEVQARVVEVLGSIAGEHPGAAVACVSHADAIKLALAHFAGVPLDLFQRIEIGPASISIVGLGSGAPRVLRINDTGPISDLRAGAAPRASTPRRASKRNVKG